MSPLYDYPDFENAIPESRDFIRGYTEHRFREAFQDLIRDCARGNPFIARGLAEEIVREETERLR